MIKKLVFSLLCAAISLPLFSGAAQAAYVTTEADFYMANEDPAVAPPLLDIKRIDFANAGVYTNQWSGTGFAPGGEVRTIAFAALSAAIDGTTYDDLIDPRPGFEGNRIYAVAALRGSIVASGGGLATADFTDGRLYILSIAKAVTADYRNPAEWALGTVISEFALAPPDDVRPGPNGEALMFDAASVNQSSANTTAGVQAQGRFVFVEDSTTAQNLIPNSGDNWMDIHADAGEEGLVVQVGQTTQIQDLAQLAPEGPTDTLDFATDGTVLNDIYIDFALKAGLGPLVWATGFGTGPTTHWNPQFPPHPTTVPPTVTTGDFRAQLQGSMSPVVVPEPCSVAIWCLGATSLGAVSAFRRRRNGARQ